MRCRWFSAKQKAYRKHLAAALKQWQKNVWAAEARETVRARAKSRVSTTLTSDSINGLIKQDVAYVRTVQQKPFMYVGYLNSERY